MNLAADFTALFYVAHSKKKTLFAQDKQFICTHENPSAWLLSTQAIDKMETPEHEMIILA